MDAIGTRSRGLLVRQRRFAALRKVRPGSRLGNQRDERYAAAPDVPTIAEASVPGYAVTAWQALFVPAETPTEIVHKISADTNTALIDPAIKDKLEKTGYLAEGSSPEELNSSSNRRLPSGAPSSSRWASKSTR